LKSYASGPAHTVSAVVVTNMKTGQEYSGVDLAQQWFRPIPDSVIDELLKQGDIMNCAGGFMIDHPLLQPYLDRRQGETESIIGLPRTLLHQLLAKATGEMVE
jgi:septum formation protein